MSNQQEAQETPRPNGAFPELPAEAWFDQLPDPGYSARARELFVRVKADWEQMRGTERKALKWLRRSEVALVGLSVASAALAAAAGVPIWVRAGVAALVTGVVALMALFHSAQTWDVKRHAATELSLEAFAFLYRLGIYASPAEPEECLQVFFREARRIRTASELDFAKA